MLKLSKNNKKNMEITVQSVKSSYIKIDMSQAPLGVGNLKTQNQAGN